ncbi:MAG: adenylyl cyclase, partial [Gammaproteobacteria bacterium]|nr:adenylyl cyclase [Gammaproteobacteria bacterium]
MPEQGRRGFLAEIQHRRVFRVAALYVVTAWVVLQVGDVIVEPLDLPEWTQRLVVTLAMLGFPIVIVLAWLFDVTPEGVVTGGADDVRPTTGRGLDIALVAIAVALVGFSFLREPTVAPVVPVITERPPEIEGAPARSIAVLPFDNLSALEENAFFAAGIHEDILAHLAQIEALTVISRTSVLRYDETDMALTEIAAELGVANILEGSVRRAGDRVRITVQLIEAATDTHLWAETYDRDLTDVFAIQTDVAKRIA